MAASSVKVQFLPGIVEAVEVCSILFHGTVRHPVSVQANLSSKNNASLLRSITTDMYLLDNMTAMVSDNFHSVSGMDGSKQSV